MYEFRGKQDGIIVFGVSAPTLDQARYEAMRYVSAYLDEGEVVVQQKMGGRWRHAVTVSKAT